MAALRVCYPGTFDPVTNGHVDLMRRAAAIFDELIVGVAPSASKKPTFSVERRIEMAREAISDIPNARCQLLEGLTAEFASKVGAKLIIKGLRAVSDFEYELQLALFNRRLNENIETILMTPSEENSFISSTLIKEIARLGGDVSTMAPPNVGKALRDFYGY